VKAPARVNWWRGIIKKIYNLGYKDGQQDASSKIMNAIITTFGDIPQADLAKSLGMTQPAVSNWLKGSTQPRVSTLNRMLSLYASRLAEPILEFEEIMPIRSGDSWRIHGKKEIEKRIRFEIQNKAGIYVFYDSAGRVTYLGKTEKCFWTEIRQRLKGKVNRPYYSPNKASDVVQGQVARKISVYEVRVPAAIHNLEVLMLRAFPNDLANTNIGNFKKSLRHHS
jgi:transcriptional regulator with XRE-family HTH domain